MRIASVAAVASILTSLTVLGRLLSYANRGIDFTDEGYYLASISHPSAYIPRHLFGFVYHPLYEMLDGNIGLLRMANIVITFSLSNCLAILVFRAAGRARSLDMLFVISISLGVASTSLLAFADFLLTPSYNSLTLQGLLVVAIGLYLSEQPLSIGWAFGPLAIGVGGWLVFMGKPSSAVLALLMSLFVVVMRRVETVRTLVVAGASALGLLFASAISIDGSTSTFVQRLWMYRGIHSSLESGHSLSRLFRLDLFVPDPNQMVFIAITALVVIVFSGTSRSQRSQQLHGVDLLTLSLPVLVLALGGIEWRPYLGRFPLLAPIGLPLGAYLTFVLVSPRIARVPIRMWISPIFLVWLPYIFSFGTNNHYWQQAGSSGVFWAISALVVLLMLVRGSESLAGILPFSLVAQLCVVVLLQTGYNEPYRQDLSVSEMRRSVRVGERGSTLQLSDGFAEYFESAAEASRHAGLTPGTSVIDLTGQSPGLLYVLDAQGLGTPWLVGGYPGSDSVAVAHLQRVTCAELSSAWVLFEPDGPRSISPSVLEQTVVAFPDGYSLRATWRTAPGTGGYAKPRLQHLYSPSDQPGVLRNCLVRRAWGNEE